MTGPGRYDDLCTQIRRKTEADGVVVIVMGGVLGTGFSAQLPKALAEGIPAILRRVADQIESSAKELDPDEELPDTH